MDYLISCSVSILKNLNHTHTKACIIFLSLYCISFWEHTPSDTLFKSFNFIRTLSIANHFLDLLFFLDRKICNIAFLYVSAFTRIERLNSIF
mmetsp:Transcript_5097/g.10752  ORF Transcript_5097/g.10752 Transcript_5097/m.10752 type:complete len:92 (+) Transcript_5097:76-351(+)